MATQRPGFTRTSTDVASTGNGVGNTSPVDPEKDGYHSKAAKEGINYIAEDSPLFDASKEDHFGEATVLTDAKDVLTHVIHVDDDPSLSPWTFRAFFLG